MLLGNNCINQNTEKNIWFVSRGRGREAYKNCTHTTVLTHIINHVHVLLHIHKLINICLTDRTRRTVRRYAGIEWKRTGACAFNPVHVN